MFLEREARRSAKGLSDLLDYFSLEENGVVKTSSGVYIAAWDYIAQDRDALSIEEGFATADRLARSFALGPGWSLQCDLIRGEYAEYTSTPGEWPDPMSMLVEEERRGRFLL
jgi:hypothetical protein